jgi:hypothetical protein
VRWPTATFTMHLRPRAAALRARRALCMGSRTRRLHSRRLHMWLRLSAGRLRMRLRARPNLSATVELLVRRGRAASRAPWTVVARHVALRMHLVRLVHTRLDAATC